MKSRKKITYFIAFFCNILFVSLQSEQISCEVQAQNHQSMPFLVCIVGDDGNKELARVVQIIKQDYGLEKQFIVSINTCSVITHKETITQFARKGYSLVLFLQHDTTGKSILCRLYDTYQGEIVKKITYHKQVTSIRGWGHTLADFFLPELTGRIGCFSSRIAYCKEVKVPGKRKVRHVYVADHDGTHAQPLVTTNTVNIAPRWNADKNNPLLFYSENLNTNIRLMSIDMHGKRSMASNFDGINMLPTFSADGKKVVFCASGGKGSCDLYYYGQGIFKNLTKNNGNNICPTFAAQGSKLFFCSDFKSKVPAIYCYHFEAGTIERITYGRAAFSPTYCAATQQLAYAQVVDGIMQIHVYDEKTKKHRQITFNRGNKEELSWSPCGNFLVFATEKKGKSRIALLTLATGKHRFITSAQDDCSYPTWSPMYAFYPVVI